MESAGIPRPRANATVEGEEVDAHWPDRRPIVEIDGHGQRRPITRRDDARRDAKLEAAGWTVLRVGADEVQQHSQRVLERIACAGRSPRSPPWPPALEDLGAVAGEATSSLPMPGIARRRFT